MDSAIRRTGFFLFLLYIVITVQLFNVMVLNADRLKKHPANKRSLILASKTERGSLLSSDGVIIAKSTRDKNAFKRVYPFGKQFSHITGYFSLRYGATGAEFAFNEALSGNPEKRFWSDGTEKPSDIKLSVDKEMQLKAYSLLKRKGAILACEVKTGRIICMVSYPSFDPNSIDRDFQKLKDDSDSPLLNRATSGIYPPGSTFKIVTLASYLENGGSLETVYEAPAVYSIGGFRITNYDKKGFGSLNVKRAFALSVNTVFAQIAIDTGPQSFKHYLERSGFYEKTGIELNEGRSRIPKNFEDPVVLAWSAVGQAELAVTPIQMLTFVSAIANDGLMISPSILNNPENQHFRRICSKETAEKVKSAMVEAVRRGTGIRAALREHEVAGKTGTAETEGSKPHAWFAGFAPAENPQIAVVVVVENSGSGGEVAAPIFKELVRYYFNNR